MSVPDLRMPLPWSRLRRRPLTYAATSTAWRSLAYVVIGAPWGLLALSILLALLVCGVALLPIGIGFLVLGLVPAASAAFAATERTRVRWTDPHTAPHPRRPTVPGRRRLGDPAVWRELAFTSTVGVLLAPAGVVLVALLGLSGVLISTPVIVALVAPEPVNLLPDRAASGPVEALPFAAAGVLALLLCLYLATALATLQTALVRGLLYSREDALDAQVDELTTSRSRLTAAFEAERRRIERDLHDGTQQQLGAVLMSLGQLEHELGDTTERARTLVGRTREQATAAQHQLRAAIRGIHPPLLTDHGLAAALDDVAIGHDPPVEMEIDVPRLAHPVESCAYFVVLEALTNAARHSHSTRIAVHAAIADDRLHIQIRDDGLGGADPEAGTGIHGLAERVAMLGGTLTVTSRPAAGTTIEAVIPCPG